MKDPERTPAHYHRRAEDPHGYTHLAADSYGHCHEHGAGHCKGVCEVGTHARTLTEAEPCAGARRTA